MGDTEAPCRGSAGAKDQEAGRHLAVVRDEQLANVAGAAVRPAFRASGTEDRQEGCLPTACKRTGQPDRTPETSEEVVHRSRQETTARVR